MEDSQAKATWSSHPYRFLSRHVHTVDYEGFVDPIGFFFFRFSGLGALQAPVCALFAIRVPRASFHVKFGAV